MNRLFRFISALMLLTDSVFAQDSNRPFSSLDRQVKEQPGGWAGSKEDLSKVFNAERTRLGERFEPQLLNYLENDIEKHYWISFFLESPSYLHGQKPLPYLSLLLKQQALSLLRNKSDQASLGDVVRLSVTAAVLSEDLGFRSLADELKRNAERILGSNSDFSASFPGMDEHESCLYARIGAPRKVECKKNVAAAGGGVRRPISGGILDRKARSKPVPIYPKEAKAQSISGAVRVEVLVDEAGEVVSARSVSGHPLLQEAAVNAARQAKFAPTLLSGQPVKVIGILTYEFVP